MKTFFLLLTTLFVIQVANAETLVREFEIERIEFERYRTDAGAVFAEAIDISSPDKSKAVISTIINYSVDLLVANTTANGLRDDVVVSSTSTLTLYFSGGSRDIASVVAASGCSNYVVIGGVRCDTDSRNERELSGTIDLGNIGADEAIGISVGLFHKVVLFGATNTSEGSGYVEGIKLTVTQELQDIAPETIIITTHGWQPTVDIQPQLIRNDCVSANTDGSRLPEVHDAIASRLKDDIEIGKVEVIDCRWPEAYTGSSDWLQGVFKLASVFHNDIGLSKAKSSTPIAGRRIATKIQKIVNDYREIIGDPKYDPQIHFIGHSLGTMVNAYAIKEMYEDRLIGTNEIISVQLATVLDSPLISSDFFHSTMPLGSVQFVDNYYGIVPFATGKPISFANPGDTGVGNAVFSHNEVHSVWYSNIIGQKDFFGNSWISPSLNSWPPSNPWRPDLLKFELFEFIEKTSTEHISLSIDDTAEELEQGNWLLSSSSDESSIEVIPNSGFSGKRFFSFDYEVINKDVDTTLSLSFNHLDTVEQDGILWEGNLDEGTLNESGTISIPIDFLEFVEPIDPVPLLKITASIVDINTSISIQVSNIAFEQLVDFTPDSTDVDEDSIPDEYEMANGMNPRDPIDALADQDNDGLSNVDEYLLGTDINNADSDADGIKDGADIAPLEFDIVDTDEDGIPDNIDNNPYVFDEVDPTLFSGRLQVLPDLTSDGVKELGVLSINSASSQIELRTINGKTQAPIKTIIWNDIYSDTTLDLHIIDDMNNNGVSEVGLFGVRDSTDNEGKPQMFVRDLLTGARVNVFNWPANWKQTKAIVLDDMTGDGISEFGLQGRFKEGNRPQLVVKSGSDTASIDTFGYPNLFLAPQFYQHSDMDDDGVPEISTFGNIVRNNKIQIKIANGTDSKDRFKAYNFPDKWSGLSWVKLDDSNGDGINDWGLFGTNKQDGRAQLIVKNGVDPQGALRIHAWPSAIQSAEFFAVPDINADGVDEVAAAGLRTNGRHQFQIQDGTDRNSVLANYNLNLNLTDVSYLVLPDLTSDGSAEIGFMGLNTNSEYELVVYDGDTSKGHLKVDNLGSWLQAPSISNLGETEDGTIILVVHGQNAMGGLEIKVF